MSVLYDAVNQLLNILERTSWFDVWMLVGLQLKNRCYCTKWNVTCTWNKCWKFIKNSFYKFTLVIFAYLTISAFCSFLRVAQTNKIYTPFSNRMVALWLRNTFAERSDVCNEEILLNLMKWILLTWLTFLENEDSYSIWQLQGKRLTALHSPIIKMRLELIFYLWGLEYQFRDRE
jgi:hypothetical protein